MSARRQFAGEPEAVSAARAFVRSSLRNLPSDVVETAELLTSELATNCVRHAHSGFELRVRTEGGVRVEVRDNGSGRPRVLDPAPRDASGRGLRIVQALSDDWGVKAGAGGKTVWFALTLAPTPARA